MLKFLPVFLALVMCCSGCDSAVKEPPAKEVPQQPAVELTEPQKQNAEEAGKKVQEAQSKTDAKAEELKNLAEQMHKESEQKPQE